MIIEFYFNALFSFYLIIRLYITF